MEKCSRFLWQTKNTGISNCSRIIFELMEEIFQNTESLAHRLCQHECKNSFSSFTDTQTMLLPWKTHLLSFKIKCTKSTPFI